MEKSKQIERYTCSSTETRTKFLSLKELILPLKYILGMMDSASLLFLEDRASGTGGE